MNSSLRTKLPTNRSLRTQEAQPHSRRDLMLRETRILQVDIKEVPTDPRDNTVGCLKIKEATNSLNLIILTEVDNDAIRGGIHSP
jgi:hypothetical protein